MPFWVDALVKGTTLLVMIFGLAAVLKSSSAATRHLLWCFGLLGLLTLPALSSVMPWHLPVLPPVDGAVVEEPIPTGAPEAVAVQSGVDVGGPVGDPEGSLTGEPPATRSVGAETVSSLQRLISRMGPVDVFQRSGFAGFLKFLWLLGASAILVRLAVGMVTLRRYSRRARPAVGPSWEAALEWASNRLLLDTPVRLLVSDEVTMPLAAGVVRPVVLMPEESERWPDDRRRAVLLHEMAHIKRRDVLPHLMAWVVCALWWFHPLAWNAARRMRSESEKACDDLVLKVGTRASRYADDLLDIVTRAGTVRAPVTVMPLAQRSEFEGRILAILEPDRKRRGVSMAHAALVALAVALLAVPLAAAGPRDPKGDRPLDGMPSSFNVRFEESSSESGKASPEGQDLRARLTDLLGKEDPDTNDEASKVVAENAGDGLVEPEIVVAGQNRDFAAYVDRVESKDKPVVRDNGRAVAAVASTLGDDDPAVRLTAAETLGKLQDPRAVEALTRALREDPDPKVRAMAAWALGQIEDPAGVPALSAALREDDDVTVRRNAAEALGEIEDASAIDALGSGLGDPSVEVRRTAVWALGMIEDARAVPLLVPLLEDSDVEVRRNVAEALGDIESSQAVDGLIQATRDSDLEVRVNAIEALGNLGDNRTQPVLVAALGDETVVVRRAAVDALNGLDLTSAPGELIRAVDDPDREVRFGAVDALDEIQDPAVVPVLLQVVRSSSDRELQYEALEALSNLESPAAYDALIPLLEHEDPKIRQLAAEAIGNMN
ncbi:MAG: M56 family metallopeptidase [Gemmatimonadota bacterium]